LAKDAAPALLDALKNGDVNLRQQAVQALQSIQTDPETLIPALAKVLKEDANAGVKITAVQVLSQHGEKGLNILIDALKDKDPGVRQQVIWSLQNVGGDSAAIVPVLAKLFKEDQNDNVRMAVVLGLWRHGARAVPLILDALKDKDANIRRQAVWTMFRLQGADLKDAMPTLKTLMKKDDATLRQGVVQVFGRIGESAIPDIIEALGDSQENVRWTAAMTLRNFGPKASKSAPILINLAVKDNNQTVRIHAMYTLVNIGDEGVVGLLKAVKDHKDVTVRRMAVQALSAFGTKHTAAIPYLVEALHDKDGPVRSQAAHTLVNMGQAGHPGLIKGLKIQDSTVRQVLLQGMINQNVRSKDAVPVLIECLKDGQGQIRWMSAQVLGNIGPDAAAAVDALTAALDDVEPMVRGTARKALKQIRPNQ
jgi:HEAT repeat protein